MTKNNELSEDYIERMKHSVHNGSFFRDSMQWYVFQYIRPSVDRNLMIMFSLIGVICVIYLYDIIEASFPLVKEVPVIIREHDTSTVRPIIKKLKDSKAKNILNADESVLKYLLSNYVTQRESFDFRDSDVMAINKKFNIIKNNSSYLEYRGFRSHMSRSNPDSPIHFFGLGVHRDAQILSFNLVKKKSGSKIDSLLRYFTPRTSNLAEVTFKTTTFSKNKEGKVTEVSKKYLAKIAFDFSGLNREEKSGVLSFSVKKYELYQF